MSFVIKKWQRQDIDICNSKSKKHVGIKFDHKLTCDDHILELCKIASQKFNLLVTPYRSISTRSILINVFFKSQFSYCPLTWICCSRNNRKISRLHELCLQIVYQYSWSLFEELLEKDSSSSFSCHQSIQNKKWFIL